MHSLVLMHSHRHRHIQKLEKSKKRRKITYNSITQRQVTFGIFPYIILSIHNFWNYFKNRFYLLPDCKVMRSHHKKFEKFKNVYKRKFKSLIISKYKETFNTFLSWSWLRAHVLGLKLKLTIHSICTLQPLTSLKIKKLDFYLIS